MAKLKINHGICGYPYLQTKPIGSKISCGFSDPLKMVPKILTHPHMPHDLPKFCEDRRAPKTERHGKSQAEFEHCASS